MLTVTNEAVSGASSEAEATAEGVAEIVQAELENAEARAEHAQEVAEVIIEAARESAVVEAAEEAAVAAVETLEEKVIRWQSENEAALATQNLQLGEMRQSLTAMTETLQSFSAQMASLLAAAPLLSTQPQSEGTEADPLAEAIADPLAVTDLAVEESPVRARRRVIL